MPILLLKIILDKCQALVYNICMMKKRRVNYNLTDRHHKILKLKAVQQELSVSELLRRILDEWINTNVKDIQIPIISDTESDERP